MNIQTTNTGLGQAVALGTGTTGTQTDFGAFNVTVNSTASEKLYLGSWFDHTTSADTWYNKNVNINVKAAEKLTIFKRGPWRGHFGENAAVQIINAAGENVIYGGTTNTVGTIVSQNDDIAEMLSGLTAEGTKETDTDAISVPYYIINNNATDSLTLAFTEETGKFDIIGPDNFDNNVSEIVVKDKDGKVIKGAINDSELDLTAKGSGEYTIYVAAKNTIYVKPGEASYENNTGYTSDSPLATITDAIDKANLTFGAKDSVLYVKLIGTDNNLFGTIDTDAVTLPAHDGSGESKNFTLHISSAESTTKATLYNNNTVTFSGDTVFDNVTIKSSNKYFYFAGNSVSFINGATVDNARPVFTKSSTATYSKKINLTLETSGLGNYIGLGAAGAYTVPTYNEDFNVTVDSTGEEKLFLGGWFDAAESTRTKYNKNVNINVKSAQKLVIYKRTNNSTYPEFKGAVQIINSAGDNVYGGSTSGQDKGVNQNVVSNLDIVDMLNSLKKSNSSEDPLPYYYIINNTGFKDALEFTETEGTYKVNIDQEVYDLLVDGEKATINDGKITIAETGSHTLTVQEKPANAFTYYVQSGAATGGNGDKDTPFDSIKAAIDAANTKKLTKIQTVMKSIIIRLKKSLTLNFGKQLILQTIVIRKTRATNSTLMFLRNIWQTSWFTETITKPQPLTILIPI